MSIGGVLWEGYACFGHPILPGMYNKYQHQVAEISKKVHKSPFF